MPISIASGLDEWMEDSRRCNNILYATLGMFNMAVSRGMEARAYWKEMVGKFLFFICRPKNCTNALRFEQGMSYSESSVLHSVPCVLHMYKRLTEEAVTLLFVVSLDEVSSINTDKRVKRVIDIGRLINTIM
jgi:hypothetical protein